MVADDAGNQNPFDLLSRKELEIAKHLLSDESVTEISSSLYLDASIVLDQRDQIFEKLQCRNIAEVKELAILHNFLQGHYS